MDSGRNDMPDTVGMPIGQQGEASAHAQQKQKDNSVITMTYEEFKSVEYSMKDKKTGRAIIINNTIFNGSKLCLKNRDRRIRRSGEDEQAIKEKLEDLGFTGIITHGSQQEEQMVFRNVKKNALIKLMEDAASNNYDNMGCFVCVIMSYGKPGVIYCPGEEGCKIDDVVELKKLQDPLKGDKCTGLVMKPKLFFLQGQPYTVKDKTDDGKVTTQKPKAVIRKIPIEADFLTYSNNIYDGHSIDKTGLSWFVDALCNGLQTYCIEKIRNNERSLNFMTVLTNINMLYAKCMDDTGIPIPPDDLHPVPLVTSLLTKHLYFYPRPINA